MIERREDKISCIRASLMSGRMGDFWGWLVFTGHEDRVDGVLGQSKDGSTVLCRPFRALILWGLQTQGVALGYHILPRWGEDGSTCWAGFR